MKIRKILKKIDCPHLTLERASGLYYMFVYWNKRDNKFNVRKVNCGELNDLNRDSWIQIGRDFAAGMESSTTHHFS